MMQPQQFKILNYQNKGEESSVEVSLDSLKDIDKRKLRKKRIRRKIPSVYTREHLVRLFTAIDNPNLAMACTISLFCGLRIAEILSGYSKVRKETFQRELQLSHKSI